MAKALADRHDAMQRAVRALSGEEAAFETGEGRREGKVGEASADGFVLLTEIRRGPRVIGETRMTVKWSELTAAQSKGLARKGGWKAEGAEAAMARAVLAFVRKEYAAAKAAIEEAGDHPLAAHYLERIEAAEKEAAYEKAMRMASSHAGARRWKQAALACKEGLGVRPDDPEAVKLFEETWSKIPPDLTLTLDLDPVGSTGSTGRGAGVPMELVYVPPGVFTMGGDDDAPEKGPQGVEKPKHEVAITKGFYVGKYEVTQAQYEAVMGANPSKWKEPDRPVEEVTWGEAAKFCRLATERAEATADREGPLRPQIEVRLPTEAEWEYACRAGSTDEYSFGGGEAALREHAWYAGNSGGHTHTVGKKKPNAWGLHDMHGNVWEWVADWCASDYYARSPREDPAGPDTGNRRVLRGGSWHTNGGGCRSATRYCHGPRLRDKFLGFRVAASVSAPVR